MMDKCRTINIAIGAICALVLFSSIANATNPITGNDVLRTCESDQVQCTAMLRGLVDGMIIGSYLGGLAATELFVGKKSEHYKKLYEKSKSNNALFLGFCDDNGIDKDQYREIFIDYVKNVRPNSGSESAVSIMISALIRHNAKLKCK